jgi:hypothetical protein
MTPRSVARIAVAHAWRFRKIPYILLALWAAFSVYGSIRNGSVLGGIGTGVYALLALAAYTPIVFADVPNGREVTALYLELSAQIDAHQHGEIRRYEVADGESMGDVIVLQFIRGDRMRAVCRSKVAEFEVAHDGQRGWFKEELFITVPLTNLVLQRLEGYPVGTDGVPIIEKHRYTFLTKVKFFYFLFRGSRGFVGPDVIRDLLHQVRHSSPALPPSE